MRGLFFGIVATILDWNALFFAFLLVMEEDAVKMEATALRFDGPFDLAAADDSVIALADPGLVRSKGTPNDLVPDAADPVGPFLGFLKSL